MDNYEIGSDTRMTARRAHHYAGGFVAGSAVLAAVWAVLGLVFIHSFLSEAQLRSIEDALVSIALLHLPFSSPTILFGFVYVLVGLFRDGRREIGGGTAGRIWLVAGAGALAVVALETVSLGLIWGDLVFDLGSLAWRLHLLFAIPTLLVAVGHLVYGLVLRRRHQRAAGAGAGEA